MHISYRYSMYSSCVSNRNELLRAIARASLSAAAAAVWGLPKKWCVGIAEKKLRKNPGFKSICMKRQQRSPSSRVSTFPLDYATEKKTVEMNRHHPICVCIKIELKYSMEGRQVWTNVTFGAYEWSICWCKIVLRKNNKQTHDVYTSAPLAAALFSINRSRVKVIRCYSIQWWTNTHTHTFIWRPLFVRLLFLVFLFFSMFWFVLAVIIPFLVHRKNQSAI